MKKRWLTATGFLFIIGLIVYFLLGGFHEIGIQMEECQDIRLAGIRFRGTPQEKSLGEAFNTIQTIMAKESYAEMNTIYYLEPAGKSDTMEVFVGFPWLKDFNDMYGLEKLIIPCSRALRARIKASSWVMPSPAKVKGQLNDFAKKNNFETQGIYIDQIKSESQVDVLAPLR